MSVTMTPAASDRVKSFIENRGKGLGLRLGIKTTKLLPSKIGRAHV